MRVFTAASAIGSGLIVLLGYFLPVQPLQQMRLILTDWAIVIAGFAVLIGVFNLISVHMEKVRSRQKGSLYGALLIISLILTFGFGLLLGPEAPLMRLAVDAVIVPVESALMAILAVTLVYASIRLLRRRVDVMSVIFLVVAVLFLFAIMPTPFGSIPGDQIILNLTGMVSRGGARGLLIGIALGTLLTGLRVLFGIDRPYGGN
jgi:hypothetical protein